MTHLNYNRKVAIFGGTFSPPTLGHRKLIEYVLSTNIVDEVWVIPSLGIFKNNATKYHHRLEMCNIAFNDIEHVIVSNIEEKIKDKTNGYTTNLINAIKELYPLIDIHFIIGGDNAEIIPTKWYKGREIITNIKFITIPRLNKDGSLINISTNKWYTKYPHIYLDKAVPTSISSTQVRAIYSEGNIDNILREVPLLVGKGVHNYITKYDLYEGANETKK